MIEIAIIWVLSKRIAAIAKAKGRHPAGYVVLFILMWIGGEFSGGFVSMATAGGGEPDMCIFYECALFGAVVGAFIAFGIVKCLPQVRNEFPLREREFDDHNYKRHFGASSDREDFTKDPRDRPQSEDDRYTTE